ncbi:NB-ARC domain-containing protein [Tychonema sp. LEGE 07196]|uniref:NB-ARC domain-containing protein n=2 Tax=unclassified Tychonema TaxID=2642144 RepID=UPI0018817DB7|nr:ATP-binding protein [Tychonema sp. LEGE 07196]MBE9132992.1 ATP-binding protein [Tychonema sp. LEGE 07196]
MDIEDALKFTDNLALTTTGKHLDSLQKAILRGAWNNQKYKEIAQEHHRSEKYVKEVGFKLWKLLSVALGEEQVCKANFRAKLENLRVSNVSLVGNGCINIRNISADTFYSPKVSQPEAQDKDKFNEKISNSEPKIHFDLSDAPEPNLFYNRTSELSTLENWVLSRTRLITIYGLSGIGKTALTLQLIPQIQHEFDRIIWRSLRDAPPLASLQTDLIKFLSQQQETNPPNPPLSRGGEEIQPLSPRRGEEIQPLSPPLSKGGLGGVINYLRSHRCLLILDDIQTIFSSQQLAGTYQPGYENYGAFFKEIAESSHNSCLILLSWEKPREIAALEGENRPCKSLQLNGLGPEAQEIFREKGLAEPEKWSQLIDLYRGNPLWLNIIATLIQDLFGGSVSEFLSYDTLFLGDLESLLQQQCDRLTASEQQVISWLASAIEPADISKKPDNLQLSPPELLKVMQSLGRRSLVETVKQNGRSHFAIEPAIREYITNKK